MKNQLIAILVLALISDICLPAIGFMVAGWWGLAMGMIVTFLLLAWFGYLAYQAVDDLLGEGPL